MSYLDISSLLTLLLVLASSFGNGWACKKPSAGPESPACKKDSPLSSSPVCGTDGITYLNLCLLQRQAACTASDVKQAYPGDCKSLSIVDEADKECNPVCDQTKEPVCGSDHKTYTNKCYLEFYANCEGRKVHLAHLGECSASRRSTLPQEKVECTGIVTFEHRPVCGSDGITYSNPSQLQQTAVCLGLDIKYMHDGECDGPVPDRVNPHGRQLDNDECTGWCPPITEQVCASNGLIYKNSCLVKQLAACGVLDIEVVDMNLCRASKQLRGPISMKGCRDTKNERLTGKHLVPRFFGRPWLKPRPPHRPDHRPPCPVEPPKVPSDPDYPPWPFMDGCDANCGEDNDPICGTGNKSFGNLCELRFFQCIGVKVEYVHDGECKK